jgi:pimeloyl-ACP methyl ester carboxylesterase
MAQWLPSKVVTNGISLNYYRSGGDKPALILCHGITDNGLCWLRVAQVLAKDYDLIMVDARGHGLSDKPERGYASSDHAADVAGLIRALGLEKPYLMGHSMGGRTVATLITTYPDLARAAILEDPPLREESDDPKVVAERRTMLENWRDNTIAGKKQSLAQLTAAGRERSPSWAEIEFGPWAQAKHQVSPNVFQFAAGASLPWPELAGKIACPTLLVTGDPAAGAIVTPEVAAAGARLNPKIQVAHIPGAGHNIRREQFEQFVAVVQAFLREV